MLDIFKAILDLANSLLGLSGQLQSAKRQRRTEMAELFQKISDCLTAVSREIRAGGVPHGRCGELLKYAQMLPSRVRLELGDDEANRLGGELRSAYNVEGAAMALQNVQTASEKERYLKEIEEASGKFQALANLVKV